MKIIFNFLLLTFICCQLTAQGKLVIIKTGKTFLHKKDVSIFTTIQDLRHDIENNGPDEIDNNRFGRLFIEFFTSDTLVIKINKYVPFVIGGLSKIKCDTILISNLPLTEYVPVDSMWQSTVIYHDDTVDAKAERDEHFFPKHSHEFPNYKAQILLNQKLYTFNTYSEPYDIYIWACTPGKIAYHQHIIGIRKYYILNL